MPMKEFRRNPDSYPDLLLLKKRVSKYVIRKCQRLI